MVPKVVEELTVHEQDQLFSAVHCSGILPLNVLAPLSEVDDEEVDGKIMIMELGMKNEFVKIAVFHPCAY